MITVQDLEDFGADTETGIKRCMGNEALYLRLVSSVPGEQGFERLSAALEKKDMDAAFDEAHALKGVLGNLSLSPLFDTISEITELLRSKTETDYEPLLTKLLEEKDALSKIIG